MLRLISLLGIVVFLFLAWGLSNNRQLFPWRTVLWGIGLQFFFGAFMLKTGVGQRIFKGLQDVITHLGVFADQGAAMAFGPLSSRDQLSGAFGEGAIVFAVTITATIILVSALSSLLYHWGILQRVVHAMAWVMQKVMGTSGSESLAAASNIFLGQTEAALIVKPYIAHMTLSEMMALMTAGMATIATGVMVVYPRFGVDAGHILTASVMSAPAALLMAKIMWPETTKSETSAARSAEVKGDTVNSIDALCRGTSEGAMLAINVMAMLIAFVAVVALANALFAWVQSLFGVAEPLTLQIVLGWLNAPFAWLLGLEWKDCAAVGQALGARIVLNEFIAYLDLGKVQDQLATRSFTLATYALCGFANFSSIAIQIGGIGALAPGRRSDLARIGFKAMIAGLLACYLTAAVVGVLID